MTLTFNSGIVAGSYSMFFPIFSLAFAQSISFLAFHDRLDPLREEELFREHFAIYNKLGSSDFRLTSLVVPLVVGELGYTSRG